MTSFARAPGRWVGSLLWIPLVALVGAGCAGGGAGATGETTTPPPGGPTTTTEEQVASPETTSPGAEAVWVLQPLPRFEPGVVFGDGRRVAGLTGTGAAVLDVATGLTVYQREFGATSALHRVHAAGGLLALSGGFEAVLLDVNSAAGPWTTKRLALRADGGQAALLGALQLRVADATDLHTTRTLAEVGARGPGALAYAPDGPWLLASLRDELQRVDVASGERTTLTSAQHWDARFLSSGDVLVAIDTGLQRMSPDGALRWRWTGLPTGELHLDTDASETVALVTHGTSVVLVDLASGASVGQLPPVRDATLLRELGLVLGVRPNEGDAVAFSVDGGERRGPAIPGVSALEGVDGRRVVVGGPEHVGLYDVSASRYVWRREFETSSAMAQQLEVLEGGGVALRWSRAVLRWAATDATPVVTPIMPEPTDGERVLISDEAGRVLATDAGVALETEGGRTALAGVLDVEQLLPAGRGLVLAGEDAEQRRAMFVVDPRRRVTRRVRLFSGSSTVHASAGALVYQGESGDWFVAPRTQPTRARLLGRQLHVASGDGVVAVLDERTITIHDSSSSPHDVPLPESVDRVVALHVVDAARVLVEVRDRGVLLSSADGSVLASGMIPPGGSWERQGLRYVWCTAAGAFMVDLGDEPRAVGRCPERRRLSADGRHLIGLVDGAVRVLRLDDGAELSLLASLRGDGSLAVALRDGSGRFDVFGSGAAPVALRRGRVESSTVAALPREGRDAGLYARYWQARVAD